MGQMRVGPMHLGALLACIALVALPGCKSIEEGQAEQGAIGSACEDEADCTMVDGAPVCLKQPAGYCSAECLGGLFDCDDQSICEQLGDQAFFCMDGCLTDNGNGDCREDYRCAARPEIINADGREVGVCLPKCESNADCEAGRRCETATGNCVPRGEKATGAACSNNNVCNGGLCLDGETFRDGYCSAQCGNQFADCEPGSLCATLDGAAVCLASCEATDDCRAGYVCLKQREEDDGSGGSRDIKGCVPRCESDAACGEGQFCDAADGFCKEGAGDPNPIGAFCGGDGDCASGKCRDDAGWRNGYCTADCGGDADCGDGICDGAQCLSRCAADLDCRLGYICADGGCKAPCGADTDCDAGEVCSPSTGRCRVPSETAGEVEQLVVAQSIAVGGQPSDTLTLEIPENTVSFAILADGAGDDLMIIADMQDPSGNTIFDFQDPFGSGVRFFPSAGQITQFLPSSPRLLPEPGEYSFSLIKEGSTSDIEVTALVKTADGEPQSGALDINFVLANLTDLDAGGAPNDADFQAAVTEMRRILETQGIEVGEVSYCDLSAEDASRFAVIDSVEGPRSELSQMFATSGRAGEIGCQAEGAINFFLVQEIVGGRAGFIILGVAGGIPGPSVINGTPHSGVAVTMAGFRRNPVQLAQTMAHEGGHYLGLFHTTEAEGTAFDPLIDTPECGAANDRNGDGIVDDGECTGSGADHLMFWAAGETAEKVSDDQGFILRRNPAIR